MKRITFMIIVFLLLFPAVCFSAYIIYLKNGGELEVDSYWQEGNQIKYRVYGGEVGIDKDDVLKIKKIPIELEEKKAEKKKDKSTPSVPIPKSNITDHDSVTDQGGTNEDELRAIDSMIAETEKKLEYIENKEKEYDDLTRERGRGKYKVLIRRERELEKKGEEIEKELDSLRKEKDDLTNKLNELRERKRMLEGG